MPQILFIIFCACRPPRGGRGLKLRDILRMLDQIYVALLAEGVD